MRFTNKTTNLELTNGIARVGRLALVGVLALAISVPAFADRTNEPTAVAMTGDLIIARPVGIAITAVGAAVFVLTLPFSAAGGNVKQSAQTLVVKPAKETFVRCLGCKTAGRYIDPND